MTSLQVLPVSQALCLILPFFPCLRIQFYCSDGRKGTNQANIVITNNNNEVHVVVFSQLVLDDKDLYNFFKAEYVRHHGKCFAYVSYILLLNTGL